jgi:hypothetical protein
MTRIRNRAGGVVQTVECLLCKCEALSSTPKHQKKPKKTLESELKVDLLL